MNIESALSAMLAVINHKGECEAADLSAMGYTPEEIAFCQEVADSIEIIELSDRPRYLM